VSIHRIYKLLGWIRHWFIWLMYYISMTLEGNWVEFNSKIGNCDYRHSVNYESKAAFVGVSVHLLREERIRHLYIVFVYMRACAYEHAMWPAHMCMPMCACVYVHVYINITNLWFMDNITMSMYIIIIMGWSSASITILYCGMVCNPYKPDIIFLNQFCKTKKIDDDIVRKNYRWTICKG